MANCRIAYFNKGYFNAIYCHFDGYVKDGVGDTLLDCYNTDEKIKSLISLGDIYSLKPTISQTAESSNRCSSGCKILAFDELTRWDIDYVYFYINDNWYVCHDEGCIHFLDLYSMSIIEQKMIDNIIKINTIDNQMNELLEDLERLKDEISKY